MPHTIRFFPDRQLVEVSFTGTVTGGSVQFSWNTSHEINSAWFVIERSRNGKDFSAVDSVAGLGSSREGKAYQLALKNAWPGQTHYRLRVTGLDGSVRYSAVQTINMRSSSSLLQVNMANRSVAVARFTTTTDAVATIQLVDLNGRLYHQEQTYFIKGQNTRSVPTANLPAGVYLVRIVEGTNVHTQKLYIGK